MDAKIKLAIEIEVIVEANVYHDGVIRDTVTEKHEVVIVGDETKTNIYPLLDKVSKEQIEAELRQWYQEQE